MRQFTAHWLGRCAYGDAHTLQECLLAARIGGAIGDTVLFLEHDPVITTGRGARQANILASPEHLVDLGVAVQETGRGGDVTFHGPGQLVAYPILDLRPDRCDVRRYVRDLARVMIALGKTLGVDSSFIEGDPRLVGVWVDEASPEKWRGDPRQEGGAERPAKVGAIGVRLSRWVTMHGFAYNLSTDLSWFRLIVPCGLMQYGMTTVAALGQRAPTAEYAARSAVRCFEDVFQAGGVWASPEETRGLIGPVSNFGRAKQ